MMTPEDADLIDKIRIWADQPVALCYVVRFGNQRVILYKEEVDELDDVSLLDHIYARV